MGKDYDGFFVDVMVGLMTDSALEQATDLIDAWRNQPDRENPNFDEFEALLPADLSESNKLLMAVLVNLCAKSIEHIAGPNGSIEKPGDVSDEEWNQILEHWKRN